jgi:hypothetical protein
MVRGGTVLDANQAEVVEPLERRRGVNARTFDRDDAGLLEARDRRIDLSGPPTERSVYPLAFTATDPPHNLQYDQIFCTLHRSEGISCLDAAQSNAES